MKELLSVLCLLLAVGNIISSPEEEFISEENTEEDYTLGNNARSFGTLSVSPSGK